MNRFLSDAFGDAKAQGAAALALTGAIQGRSDRANQRVYQMALDFNAADPDNPTVALAHAMAAQETEGPYLNGRNSRLLEGLIHSLERYEPSDRAEKMSAAERRVLEFLENNPDWGKAYIDDGTQPAVPAIVSRDATLAKKARLKRERTERGEQLPGWNTAPSREKQEPSASERGGEPFSSVLTVYLRFQMLSKTLKHRSDRARDYADAMDPSARQTLLSIADTMQPILGPAGQVAIEQYTLGSKRQEQYYRAWRAAVNALAAALGAGEADCAQCMKELRRDCGLLLRRFLAHVDHSQHPEVQDQRESIIERVERIGNLLSIEDLSSVPAKFDDLANRIEPRILGNWPQGPGDPGPIFERLFSISLQLQAVLREAGSLSLRHFHEQAERRKYFTHWRQAVEAYVDVFLTPPGRSPDAGIVRAGEALLPLLADHAALLHGAVPFADKDSVSIRRVHGMEETLRSLMAQAHPNS